MSSALDRLVAIMDRLRDPGGCPWDLEQTHATLRPYLVEETYEVLDALDEGDDEKLREELGDLLLQIVFHARLAREREAFDLDGVAEAVSRKLVDRHPHVFGSVRVSGTNEVLANWEALKKKERAAAGTSESVLAGVPRSLPALLRVFRIAEKRARTASPVPDRAAARQILDDALARIDAGEGAHGTALLGLALLAFHDGVEPEGALRAAARAVESD